MSITPSMMACATWTPRGPNSRARLCVNPRTANLPAAKVANRADPRTDAVAPVTISVGGCGEDGTASRRDGSVCCAKLKRPRLGLR